MIAGDPILDSGKKVAPAGATGQTLDHLCKTISVTSILNDFVRIAVDTH